MSSDALSMPSPLSSMNMLDDQLVRQRHSVTTTTVPPHSTTAASIWAPQPQPSETTWPRTLDSLSRATANREEPQQQQSQIAGRPELHHSSSMPAPGSTALPLVTREDVFGPAPPQYHDARLSHPQQQQQQPAKEIGVIGDGRKTITPELDSSHVEQLLRTLDLEPYHLKQKPSALNLHHDQSASRSPDFSPISISSALPTPTDLSPTRSFVENGGYKQHIGLNSPTDLVTAARTNYPGANAYLAQQHALIYDPPSPTRTGNNRPTSYASNAPSGQPIAQMPGAANYMQSPDPSSYSQLLKTFFEQQLPTTTASNHMSNPSYSPFVNPSAAHVLASSNQKLFGVGGSPTTGVPAHLLQASLRRASGSLDGSSGSFASPNPMADTLSGGPAGASPSDWASIQIPPQVLQHQVMLAHQQQQAAAALQSYQQQQLSQADGGIGHGSPLAEWQRIIEDGKLPPSISHNGASNANSLPTGTVGLGIVGYGSSAGTGAGVVGGGLSGGGLEDSIHAPQHTRSVSSYASPYPSIFPSGQQQQQQQASLDSQGPSPASSHQRHSTQGSPRDSQEPLQPINFLSLLHPSSSPPYHSFVARIVKSSDQQASIFLQQKLKVADAAERSKIVDAICARGFEMMAHRFGNWAVQRCLEAASTPEERKKIVSCMRGRIVELATNCYGCHVLQKALDCEEDIRLLIVSELLLGDPAQTLVNKHASHVWSKIMELSWTPPAPPIFTYVNKSLRGKWAALACHETGSLVVQHAFENLEDQAKDGIVDELLNQGSAVFSEVAKNQWGSYCVQHILEHGSEKHRQLTLDLLISDLLEYATNEQGYKSITKALKEGGKDTLVRVVKRMCEPAKSGSRRATIVDLALSVTGSQLIASVLPTADKDQRALLYECIRGHIVTLRGCKTGSKVIWLFDRMRAYYGY
ncbi:ARM repeat-containing protein [Marasmius fiardii PR-910]|nr:ARM repeat-containing protein [Marasmius fiardii PR-910]